MEMLRREHNVVTNFSALYSLQRGFTSKHKIKNYLNNE